MSAIVLGNQRIYMGQYEITPQMSAAALDYAAEMLDATTYGNTTRINTGGLKTGSIQVDGFIDYSLTGDSLHDSIGLADVPVSVIGLNGAEGDPAYLTRLALGKFQQGGAIGDLLKFQISGQSSDKIVRGSLLIKGNKTSSGNSTALELGAVASGKKMHSALHVLSKGGTSPTLDVIIQSDATNAFSGSHTNRITFSQKTDVGYDYKTADGAITDTWWRVNYTIGGSASPQFNFVVLLGII